MLFRNLVFCQPHILVCSQLTDFCTVRIVLLHEFTNHSRVNILNVYIFYKFNINGYRVKDWRVDRLSFRAAKYCEQYENMSVKMMQSSTYNHQCQFADDVVEKCTSNEKLHVVKRKFQKKKKQDGRGMCQNRSWSSLWIIDFT